MVNLDYLYNPAAAKKSFTENYFVDKKLDFQVIENGMILPRQNKDDNGNFSAAGFGGIVDSDGQFIKGSYVTCAAKGTYTPPQNRFNIAHRQSYISEFLATFGDIA